MKEAKEILDNQNSFTMFLVLLFKEFTYEDELVKNYNLTAKQIQNASERLMQLGFTIVSPLTELDMLDQEALFRITPNADRFYTKNPKMYVITQAGKDWGQEQQFKDKVKSQTLDNQSMQFVLQNIYKKTHAFRTVRKQVEYLDNCGYQNEPQLIRKTKALPAIIPEREKSYYANLKKAGRVIDNTITYYELDSKRVSNNVYNGLSRSVTLPDGTTFEKPLGQIKLIKETAKEMFIEHLEAKKSLTSQEKSALAHAKNTGLAIIENKHKADSKAVSYDGIFKGKLTESELLKLAMPNEDDPELQWKEMKSQEIETAKANIERYNQEFYAEGGGSFRAKGFTNDEIFVSKRLKQKPISEEKRAQYESEANAILGVLKK